MLHIHRAERADALIRALGELLATAPGDPFAPEVIAVPTRGMERWLTQQLSGILGATPGRADGICANVAFPSPRALVRDAVAVAAGVDPEADPWLPERAVWPLLEVVADHGHEPWLRSLAAHLGAEDDTARRARRFATVRQIADRFDAYALHRPDMLRGWAAADRDGGGAGASDDLPAEARWQAELWRRLRRRLGPSPAERLHHACERLTAQPALLDLPGRIALFGLTRMPQSHLDVLDALAAGRDVHLFLLHPSPALWSGVESAPPVPPPGLRAADPTAALPANRLLASWGQDAREMQLVLGARARVDHHHPGPPGPAADPPTLLARIQAGVRADRPAPGAPLPHVPDARPALDAADRSVQIHACHGRARQVEVLRDAILHLLAEDPTLEPRDVIVLCPDIETFAPLIHATFGAGDAIAGAADDDAPRDTTGQPDLRVRLADRSLRQTNPVLGAVAQLLDLAGRRVTASEVLDLADREPVRRRFRLDDEDLARMRDWVSASGIRWGLDADHRAPFKLNALEAGTWRAGLDRVLVGVTMTEEEHRLFAGVLPTDDVESSAIDLAGRMAELVHRLQAAVDAFAAPQPIGAWVAAIAAAADAVCDAGQRDAWQRAQLQRILDAVAQEAGDAPAEISLPEVRALLADRLQGRPTRANFRTGHLTVCTLVPMRSIPHRVVCLLGLDDGAFPRRALRDGDDLLLADPRLGERDPRLEDRQMLLDALMAARDHLLITYAGNDVRTNAPRPPAVPVGELLDTIGRTVRGNIRERVLVSHPLQPFDSRNFVAGALVPGGAWGFDRVTLDGARAAQAHRTPPAPFLAGPLPDDVAAVVELEDLVAFVRHPARAFLRQRLGFGLRTHDDEVDDALPVELDGLARWQIGDRMLAARLAGATAEDAEAAERARGELPPGRLADPVVQAIGEDLEPLIRHAARVLDQPAEPASIDVRVALAPRLLSGTVASVHGDRLRTATFSRVSARHRLVSWVRFLALTAAHPERPFEAVTVGRAARTAGDGATVTVVRLPRLAPERARAQLETLLELHDRGMREPVPIACLTSAAYAEAEHRGRDAARAAAGEWETAWDHPREDREPEHELVFGGILAFEALRARPGFADCARQLWAGLLAWEELDHR